jgi:hypothetical protein
MSRINRSEDMIADCTMIEKIRIELQKLYWFCLEDYSFRQVPALDLHRQYSILANLVYQLSGKLSSFIFTT